MSMWQKLASMLGVRDDQVEDALKNERGAQNHLSRRGFLLGTVALATSEILPVQRTFGFPAIDPALNAELMKLPPHWRTAIGMSSLMWSGAIAYFALAKE